MYPNFSYGWPPQQPNVVYVPMPQQGPTPNPIEEVDRNIKALEALKKTLKGEGDEKKKESKPKVKLPMFTFLETLGLMIIGGIPAGLAFTFFIHAMMQAISQAVK